MKKGQVYEGSVVRVDFPNKGIVCVGDETAVVKNRPDVFPFWVVRWMYLFVSAL